MAHHHPHDTTPHQRESGGRGHSHGIAPPHDAGALQVVLLSSVALAVVAAVELTVALASGSAGILADAFHNLGDVSTTVALAGAFILSRRAPSKRFPYGYHRSEDLAGLVVLLLMVMSAVIAGVTSVEHLLHPPPLSHLSLAFVAALIGVAGNELVAQYKIAAGRRLGSMTLTADGRHSRIDGVASAGAAVGIAGAWLHAPVLDPVAGLVITVIICAVAWDTARNVTGRLLDEADASLVEELSAAAADTPGVLAVTSVRARWTGRRVRCEITVEVDGGTTVSGAHAIADELRHRLFHRVEPLAGVEVHLDPAGEGHIHEDMVHRD